MFLREVSLQGFFKLVYGSEWGIDVTDIDHNMFCLERILPNQRWDAYRIYNYDREIQRIGMSGRFETFNVPEEVQIKLVDMGEVIL